MTEHQGLSEKVAALEARNTRLEECFDSLGASYNRVRDTLKRVYDDDYMTVDDLVRKVADEFLRLRTIERERDEWRERAEKAEATVESLVARIEDAEAVLSTGREP